MRYESGFLGGFAIALGVGTILGLNLTPSSKNKAQIFKIDNMPKIIRTYEDERPDQIYVETEHGKYISLEKYLETIPEKDDRSIQKTKIEQIVNWSE